MKQFRHDFPSSGFPIVDQVIDKTISVRDENHAQDETEAHFYQIIAAQQHGYFEPFTPEQSALNSYLTRVLAGKKNTALAWDLLHRLLVGES
jgi:hypothetical protein